MKLLTTHTPNVAVEATEEELFNRWIFEVTKLNPAGLSSTFVHAAHAGWMAKAASISAVQIVEVEAQNAALKRILLLLLDNIDYESGACGVTEMIGAILPKEILQQAKWLAKR